MSAATVLFILKRALVTGAADNGRREGARRYLMTGLGPGFSIGYLVLESTRCPPCTPSSASSRFSGWPSWASLAATASVLNLLVLRARLRVENRALGKLGGGQDRTQSISRQADPVRLVLSLAQLG